MTRIDIEPLDKYGHRGQFYRTSVNGEVILEQTLLPVVQTCRALVSMGVSGSFEAWRVGGTHPDMWGDIERAAHVTVREGKKETVRWAWYRQFGLDVDEEGGVSVLD